MLVRIDQHFDIHDCDQGTEHKVTNDGKATDLSELLLSWIHSDKAYRQKEDALPACVGEPAPENRLTEENVVQPNPVELGVR